MKKVTFKRIDNGCGNKPSYLCSNGLEIVPGDGWSDIYKYYVGNKSFDYLKDAKAYCMNHQMEVRKMDCEGCKYEDYSGLDWPCCDCPRIDREDMFEPKEDEDE